MSQEILTTKEKKQKLINEFRVEIKSLENLAKALHAKGVVAQKDGSVEIKMSANQLKELAEVKEKIFRMKDRLIDMEDGLIDEFAE